MGKIRTFQCGGRFRFEQPIYFLQVSPSNEGTLYHHSRGSDDYPHIECLTVLAHSRCSPELSPTPLIRIQLGNEALW